MIYTVRNIRFWGVGRQLASGGWVPARPEPDMRLRWRLRAAWRVFIGRYDALDWEPQE